MAGNASVKMKGTAVHRDEVHWVGSLLGATCGYHFYQRAYTALLGLVPLTFPLMTICWAMVTEPWPKTFWIIMFYVKVHYDFSFKGVKTRLMYRLGFQLAPSKCS